MAKSPLEVPDSDALSLLPHTIGGARACSEAAPESLRVVDASFMKSTARRIARAAFNQQGMDKRLAVLSV